MNQQSKLYMYLLAGAFALLFGFIFFGPITEEDKKKGYLWQKNWDAIEYRHLNNDADAIAGRDPQKLIRFEKMSSLFSDKYLVNAPDSKQHHRPSLREANANVVNIFSDWQKPEQKGYYQPDIKIRKQAGLEQPTGEISLFSSLDDSKPDVRIKTGRKQKNGNYLVEIKEGTDDPVIAVIPGHYLDKLQYDLNHYRDRRFLYFPAGTHLQDLELQIKQQGLPEFTLKLHKKQYNENGGKQIFKWTRFHSKGQPVEIPAAMTRQLEGLAKQLQVAHFGDQIDLPNPPLSRLPQAGTMRLKLRVANSKGQDFHASLESPIEPVEVDKIPVVYFKNNASRFVDYAERRFLEDMIKQARLLANYSPPKKKSSTAGEPGKPKSDADNSGMQEKDQH